MTPILAEPAATGIRSKDKPERWCVPPWSPETRLHDLVGHFLRFVSYCDASEQEQLAYYEGYLTAIEQAPKEQAAHELTRQWYGDLHYCIRRCIAFTRERLQGVGAVVRELDSIDILSPENVGQV